MAVAEDAYIGDCLPASPQIPVYFTSQIRERYERSQFCYEQRSWLEKKRHFGSSSSTLCNWSLMHGHSIQNSISQISLHID